MRCSWMFLPWTLSMRTIIQDPRLIHLALRVTLRLQEDKPSTHQNVCGGRFMSGGQMDKTQYKNDLTQKLDKQCIGK
jgi:hypothetical protein